MRSHTRRALLVLSGLALLLLIQPVPEAQAQSATVRGFVTDASNGEPMELVNVVLTSLETGVVEGVVTSAEGVYAFPRMAPGPYRIQSTFIGYATYTDTLNLSPAAVSIVNIALQPDETQLEEVIVEDERNTGVARVIAGQQTIRPADIELVPTPDLSPDLAGYLTTLPGVVTAGDQGGQLYIRGGEPTQNLVLLDGMTVYQPFHMLGFYSAFPADVLRTADLYAGGYGAQYGGRLSSVLDVTTRNGNTRRYSGSVSASPFVSSAMLEGPIVPGRASLLLSARKSFLQEGVEQIIDTPLPLDFGDILAKLYVEPGQTANLSITALNTFDRGTLTGNPDSTALQELRWRNQAIGATLIGLPRLAPFVGKATVAYSRLQSEQGPEKAPQRSSTVSELKIKAEGTFFHGRYLDTEIGVSINYLSMENEFLGTFQNTYFESLGFFTNAVYVQPDFTPFPGLSIKPGLRAQFYRLDTSPHLEPRIRITWERGAHQLSAAAGLYNQEIVGISDRRDATSIFTAWSYTPGRGERPDDILAGRIGRSLHTILGYRVEPLPGLDIALEGYYKDIDNLFVPEWTAYPRLTTRLQAATGRAYGFDARLSARPGPFVADLTYGYSNTFYEAERVRYQLWYGEETLQYRPPHDRRHQVSALLGTTLVGFDLSARWQFGSGLPYSRAHGFDGFILMDDPTVDVSQPGTRRVIYERPYNAILPSYHRLDVSVERTFEIERTAVTLQASVINAYDRRNIFYYDVFTFERTNQLPFVPSFGIKVAFE